MIRVAVVAPYASVRAGLYAMLATAPEIELIGEGAGSEDLARMIAGVSPDVVLLDYLEPDGRNSLQIAAESGIAVVALADETADVSSAAQSTISGFGYLSKDASAREISGAIAAVSAGLTVFHRGVPAPSRVEVNDSPGESNTLTHREVEVLQLLAGGLPNKVIANRLGISVHTVKFHVAAILMKLKASSRTEAVTLGIRGGRVAL